MGTTPESSVLKAAEEAWQEIRPAGEGETANDTEGGAREKPGEILRVFPAKEGEEDEEMQWDDIAAMTAKSKRKKKTTAGQTIN